MVLTREARDTPGGLSALVLGPPPPSPARAPPSPYEGKRIDRLFAPVGPVCPSPKRAHKGGSLGRCPGEGEVPVPGGPGSLAAPATPASQHLPGVFPRRLVPRRFPQLGRPLAPPRRNSPGARTVRGPAKQRCPAAWRWL